MRKRFEDKRWGMALAFLALISLILLVGALRTMDFRPGQPIGSSRTNGRSVDLSAAAELLGDAAQATFMQQVIFWGGMLVIVLLISSLLSPELRKKLIRTFIRFASFTIIFLYLIKKNPDLLAGLLKGLQPLADAGNVTPGEQIPPPVFHPPQIPSYLSFIVTFGLIILGIAVLWVVIRWWEKQKDLFSAHKPLKDIADIARLSLKNIEAGQDSNDAIIQCYDRMSHVVNSKRGLQREYSMTPAEFASRLENAGLPREPVERLTRLFESVRYGGRVSGTPEITEAVSCLTSILKYCGET